MDFRFQDIIKPVKIISENEKDIKIIETKSYNLSLLNEEYELTMNLTNLFIEFKLIEKNILSQYYYKEKFDLQTINKLLYTFFNEIKDVFNFYDKILINNKVKLILLKDKNAINLNFKNIINLDNEVESNLELKKSKINRDDILSILINEVNSLKNKLNEKSNNEMENKMKEYIDKKNNELKNEIIKDNEKILEEKINIEDNNHKDIKEIISGLKKEYEDKIKEFQNKQNEIISEMDKNLNLLLAEYKVKKEVEEQKEKEIEREEEEKKELERKNELNDNVNLINDFKFYNINTMRNNTISNNLYITYMKSVAVYNIKKNNDILYEIAYPDNYNGYNIIIYNILLNKISNIITYAHTNLIHKIKHYYDSLSKNHFLLTSSKDESVKLWNISSNPISNIIKIENCFDGYSSSPFCMLFNKGDYFILGGSFDKKKQIWNKNGSLIGPIEKSNLNIGKFIETTYIENKPYVLLSGQNHSESYDYNNDTIKVYKSNKYNCQHLIINLFHKNETIYLITGDDGNNVIIFDFLSTNEISTISVGNYCIYSLCSLNEKNILVGNSNKELKIIDVDNKSIVKNYSVHNNYVYGIEKIKIPEKGEYIITYDNTDIKLWQ